MENGAGYLRHLGKQQDTSWLSWDSIPLSFQLDSNAALVELDAGNRLAIFCLGNNRAPISLVGSGA